MSTDAFAPAIFPRLYGVDTEAEHHQARLRGYAEGHAEAFRIVTAEAKAAAAQDEARRADARVSAQRALADAMSALGRAADALEDRARDLADIAERQISSRAVELAELILAEALADRELAATTALRRGLAAQQGAGDGKVHLSPTDLHTLTLHGTLPENITVVTDEALVSGDAVAVVADGFVDARIGAALERARRALAEVSS